jgi:hypothetical protein
VAAAAVVGTSTVTARRDHVHPGTTGAGTVVDEAITRFNGTGGASIQGYSSLSPTISDAGIISLTSGALKFPATEISSTEPNTLWDYQIGDWTPAVTFGGYSAGIGYSVQRGTYVKIGRMVTAQFYFTFSSKGSSIGVAALNGLPFGIGDYEGGSIGFSGGVSFANQLLLLGVISSTRMDWYETTEGGTTTAVTNAEFTNTTQQMGTIVYQL